MRARWSIDPDSHVLGFIIQQLVDRVNQPLGPKRFCHKLISAGFDRLIGDIHAAKTGTGDDSHLLRHAAQLFDHVQPIESTGQHQIDQCQVISVAAGF